MFNNLFSLFYGLAVVLLLYQAIRVMARGFQASNTFQKSTSDSSRLDDDRTGRLTVHPEILDSEGRITDEDLLTVRFSEDVDPPKSS